VAHTQDDGFHEIQLNGKQLVFLFMAATVVSVVIFLCGVLVGRGVRGERALTDIAVASAADTTPQPAPAPPASQPTADADPTKAAAPPATEDLSYFSRLEKSKTPAEQLKPAATAGPAAAPQTSSAKTPAPPPAAKPEPKHEPAAKQASTKPEPAARQAQPKAEPIPKQASTKAGPTPKQPSTKPDAARPAPAPSPAPAEAAATDASVAEPGGFSVQIAALNERGQADAIAKRLSSKGYTAYVMSPADGTPSVYRVRVGKFPTRREAESIAAKLQKEEQFKPWVTR
jgi:DedD protein